MFFLASGLNQLASLRLFSQIYIFSNAICQFLPKVVSNLFSKIPISLNFSLFRLQKKIGEGIWCKLDALVLLMQYLNVIDFIQSATLLCYKNKFLFLSDGKFVLGMCEYVLF